MQNTPEVAKFRSQKLKKNKFITLDFPFFALMNKYNVYHTKQFSVMAILTK